MLIPYGTDTPIYHWPVVTGILILLNILAFPLTADTSYYLSHGDGIHVLEWVTSMFAHLGLMHLIGNLVFLALFGAIVEGKTGPVIFSILYLVMGFVQNGIIQVIMLNADLGYSLGASGAIFGLMMCAMLFAPKDNILCIIFLLFFVPPIFAQIPILIFALIYFMWDFSIAFLLDFPMSTSFLHIMGGFVGLGAGALLLQMHWVDCEGEDLFSMFREITGKAPRKRPATKRELREQEEEKARRELERMQRIEVAWRSINAHFAARNYAAAAAVYHELHRKFPEERWDESQLLTMIRHFTQQKDWPAVTENSIDYLNRFEAKAATVSINLAKIQLLEFHSPTKAIELIRRIDGATLSSEQKKTCRQILLKAQKMQSEGALELRDD